MRRRGNLRVRKARMARSVARWTGIVLFQAALAGVLAYSGWSIAHRIVNSPTFDLRRIELDGASRASADGIREELSVLLGRNVFELDLRAVEQLLKRDRWIRTASVKRVLPDTLRLRLTEREPVALALIGGRPHVVDATGYVIGLRDGREDGLPVLVGLDGLDDESLAGALRRGVESIARLEQAVPPFAREIDAIDVSRADRVTVRRAGDGAEILLDPARIERNVIEYMALHDQIERRLGEARTVDLRWRDRITVMPGNRATPRENG
jgi:cell division protein FtsQ